MLSHILPPALSLLVILGFAAVVGLLFLVVNTVALKMSGWKEIAERFPMRDAHFTSDSYRKRQGAVGKIGSGKRGFFDIRLAVEGVCVYPLFARRNPCLVPWSAIRRVSISASGPAGWQIMSGAFRVFFSAGRNGFPRSMPACVIRCFMNPPLPSRPPESGPRRNQRPMDVCDCRASSAVR